MCFASALYFTADMGVSAYDAYALILDKRTRIPFRMCRIGTDVITTAAGFFMGAVVGVSLWKREETDTEAVKQKAVVVR